MNQEELGSEYLTGEAEKRSLAGCGLFYRLWAMKPLVSRQLPSYGLTRVVNT